MEKGKMIICSGCGGEFADSLPQCPYCGLLNYKGAEQEYLDKLEDVREDMGDLVHVHHRTAKEELKKQGHLVRKILIIIGIVVALILGLSALLNNIGTKSEKEQFLWKTDFYPQLDALYEEGNYEKMVTLFNEGMAGEYSVWDWEHKDFAIVYGALLDAKESIKLLNSGEEVSEYTYTSLLYNQMDILIQWERDLFTEEERGILEPLMGDVIDDFESRWKLTDEEYEYLRKLASDNYNVLPYDECEKFVKKWLKEKR